MCCARLAGNAGPKKSPKIRHLGTIAQICRAISSQLRHISIVVKKLIKQQYFLHMSSQYGELRPISGWDLLASLRHPGKFQRVLRLVFVTAATSLKLYTMFGRVLDWCTIYTFPGLLPRSEILPREKFTLRPTLAFSYIDGVTARHSSSGRQGKFAVSYGMELRNFRRGRHLYSAGRPSR